MESADDDANKQYNDKVLASGAWIDTQFLQDVLSASLENDAQVVDHQVTAAVGAGENYLSILYRTAVTYTVDDSNDLHQKFLMIKGVPIGDNLVIMLEVIGAFEKEMKMYNNAFPAMLKYLKQYFSADSEHVVPEPYVCSRPDTIVMEDISKSGYKMANRMDQLDLAHCIATLRTLARFHALSVKLYNDNPQVIHDITTKELYSEVNRPSYGKLLDEIYPVLTAAMSQWGDDARFVPTMEEISRYIWDKLMFAVRPSEHLNVLNHGDMWVNNIMFKYDENGEVTNAKLVDFQLTRYTTPAIDLLYFFFTSPKADTVASHMPEMMQTYHEALTADIAKLGLDVDYPLQQLEEDMKDRCTYSISAMAQILPLVLSPASDAIDFGTLDTTNIKPEDHPMVKNYMRQSFRESVGKLLNYMEGEGYLEACVERTRALVEELDAQQTIVEPRVSTPRPRTAQQLSFIERMFRILSQPMCE